MEEKVNNFKLNGNSLQDTFFIKNKEHHKCLLLHAVEAKFKFEYNGASGNCAIVFEFPYFAAKRDCGTEFEVTISSLVFASGFSHVNRTEAKEELLRRINAHKLVQFAKNRIRSDRSAVDADGSDSNTAVQLKLV
jgi:hypothetical protein